MNCSRRYSHSLACILFLATLAVCGCSESRPQITKEEASADPQDCGVLSDKRGDANARGASLKLPLSQAALYASLNDFRETGGSITENEISFVAVRNGCRLRLCDHESTDRSTFRGGAGGGICSEFGEGEHTLAPDLDDRVSFIQVAPAGKPFLVAGAVGYTGWDVRELKSALEPHQKFHAGQTYRGDRGELNVIGDNALAIIAVATGFRIKICDTAGDGSGGAPCEEFTGPGDFMLKSTSGRASFVHVTPLK